jgi:hypothetical protein
MESQKFSQTQYKILYLFSFINIFFIHITFYKKFDKTYQFFPCKKANYEKGQDCFKKKFENCVLNGLDTEPKPEPELEPAP